MEGGDGEGDGEGEEAHEADEEELVLGQGVELEGEEEGGHAGALGEPAAEGHDAREEAEEEGGEGGGGEVVEGDEAPPPAGGEDTELQVRKAEVQGHLEWVGGCVGICCVALGVESER